MVTLGDALIDLVRKGVIDTAEAYSHAVNKADFKAVLERHGFKLQAA